MTTDQALPNQKFIVTGATGWVGRTFLHELQSIIPSKDFNKKVKAFGSKTHTLLSTNYPPQEKITIPIYPLTDLKNHADYKNSLVLHCAFLTKDRISEYGISQFIEINQQITDTVAAFLERNGNCKVINISSGAAAYALKENRQSLPNNEDAYGYLKLREEKQISSITDTQIFRIYALTGRFIRDPMKFAIGDLLTKAIQGKQLVINSDYPVIRSYVNASDLAKGAIQWLTSSDAPQNPISAASHITTLQALGQIIAKQYHLPPPIVKPFNKMPNSYSHSPIIFDKFLKRHKIKPLTLKEQIIDTARGITVIEQS